MGQAILQTLATTALLPTQEKVVAEGEAADAVDAARSGARLFRPGACRRTGPRRWSFGPAHSQGIVYSTGVPGVQTP